MTLLMWLGLTPVGSLTHPRGTVCGAAPPGNPRLAVSTVERMEPIPPG
jgi:hypothetical protein